MQDFLAPVGTDLYVVNTGDWRTHRPLQDRGKCTDCGTCFLYCPTGSVKLQDGRWFIDLSYCKGCGICSEECPRKAIRMVEEKEAGLP